MFDPTIYENLKVVLEGCVYDLDLEQKIQITDRADRIDLSTMSRCYELEFRLNGAGSSKARIYLQAHLHDLAAEILEQPASSSPGCTLEIALGTTVRSPESECPDIEAMLQRIWGPRPSIAQKVSYVYGTSMANYELQVTLGFGRKVNEGQIEDFPGLLDYAMQSLDWLDRRRVS